MEIKEALKIVNDITKADKYIKTNNSYLGMDKEENISFILFFYPENPDVYEGFIIEPTNQIKFSILDGKFIPLWDEKFEVNH